MLSLTKKTDYALIALAQLAQRNGRLISAREVAESGGVPLPILTNILKTLTHAGIVGSERGSRGGYFLARAPESISLDDLITAIEGPRHFVKCFGSAKESATGKENGHGHACTLEPTCPIRLPAQRVHERFRHFLNSVTLAELGVESTPVVPLHTVSRETLTTQAVACTELRT